MYDVITTMLGILLTVLCIFVSAYAGYAIHKRKFRSRISTLAATMVPKCKRGTWDQDDYSHGLANGLMTAFAIMNDEPIQVFPKKHKK